MRRAIRSSKNASRALRALVGVAALGALACDNSVSFTGPTVPESPVGSRAGIRNLQIYGSLEARDGAFLEATVFYDGVELAAARSRCPEPGCARLELQAQTPSPSGHHPISFRVLRQSRETLDSVGAGRVLVLREGVMLGGATLPLGPVRADLAEGGAVSFEVEFTD